MSSTRHFFDESRFLSQAGGSSGATVYFYNAGTSTLAAIYNDSALTSPAANPFGVAVGAIVPTVFLDASLSYRRRIEYTDGTVYDVDNISPDYVAFLNANTAAGEIKTSSGNSIQAELDSRIKTSAGIDFTNIVPISASTQLGPLSKNAVIVATTTSGSGQILINLPVVSSAEAGTSVVVAVSGAATHVVAIQASAASGLTVGNRSSFYLAQGESALFVRDATEWKVFFQQKTAMAAELQKTTALALTSSFQDISMVAGSQLMLNPTSLDWFSSGYYKAPRSQLISATLRLWISSTTGASGQVDAGLYRSPTLGGAPTSESFSRTNVATPSSSFQLVTHSGLFLMNQGDYLVPSAAFVTPLSSATIAAGVTSTLRIHEVGAL